MGAGAMRRPDERSEVSRIANLIGNQDQGLFELGHLNGKVGKRRDGKDSGRGVRLRREIERPGINAQYQVTSTIELFRQTRGLVLRVNLGREEHDGDLRTRGKRFLERMHAFNETGPLPVPPTSAVQGTGQANPAIGCGCDIRALKVESCVSQLTAPRVQP